MLPPTRGLLVADTGAAPTANANGTRVDIKGSGLLSDDVALDSITLAGTAAVEVSATNELVAVTAQASGQTADGGVALLPEFVSLRKVSSHLLTHLLVSTKLRSQLKAPVCFRAVLLW